MAAIGSCLLALVIAGSIAFSDDAGEPLTRNTIRLSLAWYSVALVSMTRLSPQGWDATNQTARFARGAWTWSYLCFVTHVGMAFHYFHNWSHQDAMQHTEQISGVGEGLYVSYLFACLWGADVFWWWIDGQDYSLRNRWIGRVLHSFMLFIVFNSVVVFETGPIRWIGVAAILVFSITRLRSVNLTRILGT